MNDHESSRYLVSQTLAGRPVSRAVSGPLAVHYCARVAGVSMREYTLNPRALADCVIRYHEIFRPDAIWLSADTWVTASALGAATAFPAEDVPMAGTGEPTIRNAADIDRIPPPDPRSQGRWPLMLEALRQIVDALGNDVFIVACFDQYPFSLACALMGIEKAMTSLTDDRPMVEALMERCADYAVAYALALAAAGAHMLSGGDSPAGLVGPRLYREVALPREHEVISRLKSRVSLPVSLHICGNTTHILADMAASGADVLELDHQLEIARACQVLGPEIGIWGNLDPVALLAQGTPEAVRRATIDLMEAARSAGHARLVVSSGCTLAPETPAANLVAMLDAVRQCGHAVRDRTIEAEGRA
ncbi:MAG: uroporphyrinogen decarboxylase family protein [Isosphaeraceae bacterium]